MADPMEGAANAVKRVPKWAWIAGGGISAGIIFYRWRSHGTASAAAPGDQTAPGDYAQTPDNPGYVTAAPAVNADAGAAYGYPSGGIPIEQLPDLLGAIQATTPPPTSAVDLINSILPYIGGGAPTSDTTYAPPAPPPAAPVAPPPPAPKPAAPKCSGEFPFDAGGGDCYKVVCASGKGGHAKGRWHFHKNGKEVRVASTC